MYKDKKLKKDNVFEANKMRAGIYCIMNTQNHNRYIGQTKCFAKRKDQHFTKLRHNKHHNSHLQHSYNRYSEKAFTFYILEYVEDYADLDYKEQYWIDQLRPEYNVMTKPFEKDQGVYANTRDVLILAKGEEYRRPTWHAWVYGGARNPALDGRENR